ncbi:MAG: ATP-binding protein [Chitinispirillales bacterium]|jgi:hypothetical protein|nr:ATP-binding protein [Chitinispirillales bacterium]
MRIKPLPIGQSFFNRVIEDGYYYVDKTLFIRDILDSKATVILCTRPRRFGKTLNQTMLKCFFEDTTRVGGKDTRPLFNGLKIEAAGEEYFEHQGKYPVIFLSFKEGKLNTFEESYNKLKNNIAREFKRHAYVAEKISDDDDLAMFERLRSRKSSREEYSGALKFLSECLENFYGQKTVILIDEYDVPLENAWSCGFYDEMDNFIRPLLSDALKDNSSLQLAVITGCLRVSKETIFTGLNNLDAISILTKDYSEYFGFTQSEIDAMLRYYGLESNGQTIRNWYDGYLFGDTEVYNPWSSVNVMKSWRRCIDEFPKPYWANTSGNDIVRELVDRVGGEAKAELETLLAGGTILKPVQEDITYNEIYKNADNLWNFMFFTGYLKKVGERSAGVKKILELSIPNMELQYIYETKIQDWFNERIAEKNLDTFFRAILSGDTETFQAELSALLVDSISFMDNAENFYHGFMTDALSRLNKYIVKSNRESGHGRSDIVLYSMNGIDDKAIIFELKLAKSFDELSVACEDALEQIEKNNYAAYWHREGYRSIIKYGLGFYKKRCEVKKGT